MRDGLWKPLCCTMLNNESPSHHIFSISIAYICNHNDTLYIVGSVRQFCAITVWRPVLWMLHYEFYCIAWEFTNIHSIKHIYMKLTQWTSCPFHVCLKYLPRHKMYIPNTGDVLHLLKMVYQNQLHSSSQPSLGSDFSYYCIICFRSK